ncbi:lipopolysaccharide biosynthesis protein [Phocaeicola sp.]
MLKKLIVNSAVFGIAPQLPRVISVFLLPVLTAYLTEADYGIIGTVTAYTAALSAFTTLGLTQIFFNSFYHHRCQYKWLWRELYGFLQIWVLIFAVIQGIILYLILPQEAEAHKYAIILLSCISLAFSATSLVGNTYYQLQQTPLPIAVRTVIGGLLTVLINYYLVVHSQLGYMGFFWASCIATVVVNLSYVPVVYFKLRFIPIYRFKRRTIKRSLGISLPIIPHTYSAYLLNTSNRLVMDRYHMPISTIGEFNIAQQFSNLMDSFTGAVNQAINPMTLNELRDGNVKNVRKLIYIYLSITLIITSLLSLWLREVFDLLISNDVLKKTYPYAIILIMAQNARPMYVASSNIFFYYENTTSLLKITFIAGIISFLGYVAFIPFWGIWAAVVVYYFAMVYMGYAGFHFKFYKEKVNYSFPILKILLLSFIMTVGVFLAVDFIWEVKMIVTVVLIVVFGLFVMKKQLYKI